MYGPLPAKFLFSWGSPGENTRVVNHALLQGIFLPGIEPASLTSPALACGFLTTNTTWEVTYISHLPYPVTSHLLRDNKL